MKPQRSPRESASSSELPSDCARYWLGGVAAMLLAASAEFLEGRKLWGTSGEPGIWSGEVLSSHNSQYLFDPYTFTHLTHGILIYGALWWLMRDRPLRQRAIVALVLECGWEVLENSNFVIQRYRAQTLALNYFGDSVMNSMADILTCMTGFLIASKLPTRATVVLALALEVGLALWIRDGLLLNIVMLIHPLHAIAAWQAGYN